jgi:DNA-directed RNA polymerase subunit RPC12/RpoP
MWRLLAKSTMFSCSTCAKTFQAQQSLEQHMEATGHILCNACGKGFNTLESLSQHKEATGQNSKSSSKSKQKKKNKKRKNKSQTPSLPDPPFPGAEGYWVEPSEFKGKKSFGYFKCKCNASWLSAHSYTEYKQDCKSCRNSMIAILFWINNHGTTYGDNDEKDESKPHMRHLCEACKLGVCDMSTSGSGVRGYDDY